MIVDLEVDSAGFRTDEAAHRLSAVCSMSRALPGWIAWLKAPLGAVIKLTIAHSGGWYLVPDLYSMASRSVKLDGSQLSADAVRVVHLIADRFENISWTRITDNVFRRPVPNWMGNDLVEYSDGTPHR
jgi:hypothetical protein